MKPITAGHVQRARMDASRTQVQESALVHAPVAALAANGQQSHFDGTTQTSSAPPPAATVAEVLRDADALRRAVAQDPALLRHAAAVAFADGVKSGTSLALAHVTQTRSGFRVVIARGSWFLRGEHDSASVLLDKRGAPARFQSPEQLRLALAEPALADEVHRLVFGAPLPQGAHLDVQRCLRLPPEFEHYGASFAVKRGDELLGSGLVSVLPDGTWLNSATVG